MEEVLPGSSEVKQAPIDTSDGLTHISGQLGSPVPCDQILNGDDCSEIATIANPESPFATFGDLNHAELVDSILPKELKDSIQTTKLFRRSNNSLEFDEVCPICGDRVSGYHYGILTCESCKGFFKRSVQNKKQYQCVDKRDCVVNKVQRKRCPACRYAKCIAVGMKIEAVREDRLRGGRNKFGPLYKHDRAIKQQKKAMIRNSAIMHSLANSKALSEGTPSIAGGMAASLASSLPENPKIKVEKPPQGSISNHEDYHSEGHSRSFPRFRARNPYPEYFHPYFTPPEDPRFFYGYPYPDPRYHFPPVMSSFRPPFMPRPYPMRPYEDEAYYKSRNSYFGDRRHSLPGSLMSRHEPPIPFPSHDPAGSDPGQILYPPEAANFVRHGGPSTSPASSSRTSDYGDSVQAMPRNSNPFECSNEELVKKMISSWIPEEDIRKHAQITEPGLNPFSLIVRCVDRILFSLVDWAKSSVFFRDMSTEDQMSLLHETWSELVLLDHIYRQVWFSDDQNVLLVSGKSIALAEIQGVFDDTGCKVFDRVADMTTKFRQVRIDRTELCCLKFLILFNARDSKIQNHQFMTKVSERINSCLLEYVYSNYPNQADRFLQLLMRLPDVRALSNQVEQWLNDKFMAGLIGPNTLVAEMLNVRFQKNM